MLTETSEEKLSIESESYGSNNDSGSDDMTPINLMGNKVDGSQPNRNFKANLPVVEGLPVHRIKEYKILGEMGLDDLIPLNFRTQFTIRDTDGNYQMPVVYKDHINSHGYGAEFIDQLRVKKGHTFARSVKSPVVKAKYI